MAQDGGESNVLDPLDFYVEPRPMRHPTWTSELLSKYFYAENIADHSDAGLWHASFIGTICPSGHNTGSSEARFGKGAWY